MLRYRFLYHCQSVRPHIEVLFEDMAVTNTADGTKVQEGTEYSSYLLYCINKTYTQINKLKCRSNLSKRKEHLIEGEIIRSGKL